MNTVTTDALLLDLDLCIAEDAGPQYVFEGGSAAPNCSKLVTVTLTLCTSHVPTKA